MSTPYTLMRCRMKDLISCFNVCKVTIEKDTDESDHQKPKPSSIVDDRIRRRDKQVEFGTTVEERRGEESPASWQSCESEEDDYIVFYFKDDGSGGGVIEERCLERSPWREDDAAGTNRRKKKQEMGKKRIGANLVSLETEGPNESDEHRDRFGGSSDSSTSTNSFAFPAIKREWTGSPVLMPRPEGHNKSKSVCIQCCKF